MIQALLIILKDCGMIFTANSFDTVNNLWLKLKYAIECCEEHFIPSKMKRTKRETPWITRDIIYLKRKIQRMHKRRDNPAIIRQLSDEFRTKLKNSRRHFISTTLIIFMNNEPQILALFVKV